MLLAIPAGQFYGGLIEDILWIVVGLWLVSIRPHRIRQKVARGELSEQDAQTRLRKLPPMLGYAAIIFGIGQTFVSLDQIGFFGRYETLAGALMLGGSIVVVVFVLWRRRREC